MPVPRKTATQFEQDLASGINARNSSFDTTYGPIKDFSIRPQARVFEAQNERVRKLYSLLALQSPSEQEDADMDAFVATEQVIRSNGTASFTTLTFARASLPTVDLPIPANFPVGTEVDSTTGGSVTYVTQDAATLYAATAASYYNPTTKRYELDVPAASITLGDGSKVGANKLKRPLLPLPGFDSVTNKIESRGGLAAESNDLIAERYLLRKTGTEIGTPSGLERYILQTFGNVEDVYEVYGNSADLLRADTDAGAVDVWIQGSTAVSRTLSVECPGRLILIPFDRQPGIAVTQVQSGAIYTEGVDYVFVEDAGIYGRSTRATDGIVFLATGACPPVGATINITYTYDSLIVALQSFFNRNEDYYEHGRDALFRRGKEIAIAIHGGLKVKSGNPNTVLAAVIQGFQDYVNGTSTTRGYRFGATVERFDLDGMLSRIPGVDNFTYTLLARAGSAGIADITMLSNEYARLSLANLSVTLI